MFIKTILPSSIGHAEPFNKIIDSALNAGFYGYWFTPSLDFNIEKEELKKLVQIKHAVPMGMEIPVEFRESDSQFETGLQQLRAICEYAKYIGIKRASTWIVPYHDKLCYSKNFQLHVVRLRRILDILDEYGIVLGLEFQGPKSLRINHKYWFVHSLDGIFSLISAINRKNVGIIMDIWHWELSGMTKFDFGQFESGDQIVAVHINDAPVGVGEFEYQDLSRELPCSTGILKTKEFLIAIDKLGFNGPLIVEPFYDKLSAMPVDEAFHLALKSMNKALGCMD